MTPDRRSRSRGQGLVEFALATPILLMLLLGLLDLGRVAFEYTTISNASRAAARVAIVNQSNDTTCAKRTFKCVFAEQAVAAGIRPSDVPDAVITGSSCALSGDCEVTVTVTRSVSLVTPVLASLVGPVTLEASTTMPIERTFADPANP